jgi:hypothetical protein
MLSLRECPACRTFIKVEERACPFCAVAVAAAPARAPRRAWRRMSRGAWMAFGATTVAAGLAGAACSEPSIPPGNPFDFTPVDSNAPDAQVTPDAPDAQVTADATPDANTADAVADAQKDASNVSDAGADGPWPACAIAPGTFPCGTSNCDPATQYCDREIRTNCGGPPTDVSTCVADFADGAAYSNIPEQCRACPTAACIRTFLNPTRPEPTVNSATVADDDGGVLVTWSTDCHGCYGCPPARLERLGGRRARLRPGLRLRHAVRGRRAAA